jgi:hypothetical protein
MWIDCARFVTLIGCVVIGLFGCEREIRDLTLTTVPAQGCIPLQVELIGTANIQNGANTDFRWKIGNAVELRGPQVRYTFTVPGRHEAALTVRSGEHRKTKTTTIEVREATLPPVPGLYLRSGCTYQELPQVVERSVVKDLGKTSLQDLEQRIVGRPLSTSELVTHPLWRRPHTHDLYTLQRDQFVTIPLSRLQSLGFVLVGKEVSDATLFQVLTSPEPERDDVHAVVTRMIDSWGIEDVTPKAQPLRSTEIAPHVSHYMPDGTLTEGLYFIDFKTQGKDTPGISPVALSATAN